MSRSLASTQGTEAWGLATRSRKPCSVRACSASVSASSSSHSSRAVLGDHVAEQFEARVHEREPARMLQIVIVVLERAPRVIRWINGDALDAPGVIRQQGFERAEVVALNE